jgi:hypothetical protein
MKSIILVLGFLFVLNSVAFSFGKNDRSIVGCNISVDLINELCSEYDWHYYQRINLQESVWTDTILSLSVGKLKPPVGVTLFYGYQVIKNVYFDLSYTFTTMEYSYTYINGLHKEFTSEMTWLRHSVDLGASYALFSDGKTGMYFGVGVSGNFHTNLLEPGLIDDKIKSATDSYQKTRLKLNDVRGEYLYLSYRHSFPNSCIKYNLTFQINGAENMLIGYFFPTIKAGIWF